VEETGRWLREAGIEISYYVLLGLGGAERWREHIDGSVRVLKRVNPEFIRIRRLWLYHGSVAAGGREAECPLCEDIRAGTFVSQSPEGTVLELRRLVEGLTEVSGRFLCDHANNYIRLEGALPRDRERLLELIDEFLSLPEEVRARHYEAVGSRI
jgi:hypothetical protein